MNTLYLECSSGISGDMMVGALLDLGADRETLLRGLNSLGLSGYQININKVIKGGVSATSFDVILDEAIHIHNEQPHTHIHADGTIHTHTHIHHGDERSLKQILPIIEQAAISPHAKQMAVSVFQALARAEGTVHGQPPEEVVFHEVGAVDSIVDIIAAAVCLDNLQVEKIICSPLTEGTGYAWCRHGKIPVPVPAVAELSRQFSIPLRLTDTQGEMVTPTGAAIVAALACTYCKPESLIIKKIGIGAGKKEFPHANVLRVMFIEEAQENSDRVCVLKTAIDDSTAEQLAFCQKLLFNAGALDAYFTPIVMKKSRPATELTVLCKPSDEEAMTELLFRHTSTIGLRKSLVERRTMNREMHSVELPEGTAMVKTCRWKNIEKSTVEYETAAALAQKNRIPLDEMYRKVYLKLSEIGKTQKMQDK